MHQLSEMAGATEARTLILSLRNLERHAASCIMTEFEQIVHSVDNADFLAPTARRKGLLGFDQKTTNRLVRLTGLGRSLSPAAERFTPSRQYDLFFFYCQYLKDLFYLNAIPNWRKTCRKAVCWIDELWAKSIENGGANILKLLEPFDQVFLSSGTSFDSVNRATGLNTKYLPFSVDAIKFCPLPHSPERFIDVYSIGRRPERVHKGLMEMVHRGDFYYHYDTSSQVKVDKERRLDHRTLYSDTLKRSRYFIAYRGKFDLPKQRLTQEIAGPRFFEGAAAGAVLIGMAPDDPNFRENFDWPDAVLEVPIDTDDMDRLIAGFDSQEERLEKIRRDNVVNSLLRHDWVYRWERILHSVGLEPLPALSERKKQLHRLASVAASDAPDKVRVLRCGSGG